MRRAGSLTTTASAFSALAENILATERFVPPTDLVAENREFASHLIKNLQPFGSASVAVQVGMLAERLTQAETANNALQVSNRRLRENLTEMKKSLSWKVTAPLRWLGEQLSR